MIRIAINLAIIVAMVTLLVVFAIQNTAVIQLKFLYWEFEARRALLILGVLIIGNIIGVISTLIFLLRGSR